MMPRVDEQQAAYEIVALPREEEVLRIGTLCTAVSDVAKDILNGRRFCYFARSDDGEILGALVYAKERDPGALSSRSQHVCTTLADGVSDEIAAALDAHWRANCARIDMPIVGDLSS